MNEPTAERRPTFGQAIQVRLVSDLRKSQAYYHTVLGCQVDDWGHAERGGMVVILQQASSPEDIRPNAPAKKRQDYPTEWEGPDHGWDTFIHVQWEDFEPLVEEIREKGGTIAIEPFSDRHGEFEFKNVYIQDPDGYHLVLGAMRKAEASANKR
ncbi:VOC family protein [Halalkalibacterium halodurans]|uniref:VOC family protein n=1 Tax=Halalkalibacterium halodurans TaxID=86665 RepID=UPI002E23732F|nr:VOC family protein [Halalkalibacterium halodurans]